MDKQILERIEYHRLVVLASHIKDERLQSKKIQLPKKHEVKKEYLLRIDLCINALGGLVYEIPQLPREVQCKQEKYMIHNVRALFIPLLSQLKEVIEAR